MDGGAFAHVAPDTVYIPVMPNGEEPRVNIGTALLAMLLRICADEGVLDETIGPRTRGLTRENSASSHPPMFSAKYRPGVAPESQWHRCNFNYGKAQSFQDLLLCRSLRLIGDELHAGLAGSSRISV
jgi:hypothetical protein